MNTNPMNDEQLRAAVSNRYARVALNVLAGEPVEADPCCEPSRRDEREAATGCSR